MTIEKLREIAAATLPNCDVEGVTAEAMLVPDLCTDSLDTVELSMALEENTGVQVGDDLMATFRTVGDLLDYMTKRGA